MAASWCGKAFLEIDVCGSNRNNIKGLRRDYFCKALFWFYLWSDRRLADRSQSLVMNWIQAPTQSPMFWFESSGSMLAWLIRTLYVWVVCEVCAGVLWGESGVALAVFILSVFPRSLSFPPPSRHCVLHQPPSIPQSFEKVGALFSFVTPLFQKASLIETAGTKKKKRKKKIALKVRKLSRVSKNEESKAAAKMTKRFAHAAECLDCIVRPCVQNPWYCLHSPINVFCMVWSCCHGDPRIGRLKRGNVCMEGVREKEKGAPLAWVLTDGLTQEHGAECVHAQWYAQIVILLNLQPCHVLQLYFLPFCFVFFYLCVPSPMSSHLLHLLHWLGMLHLL